MLYEPPKTKQYILIGAIAVVLAVLVIVAAPLIYKSKTTQAPTANYPITTEQKKIQKERIQKDMQEAAKKLEDQSISEEDMAKANEELKKIPNPSREDMQKAAKELN